MVETKEKTERKTAAALLVSLALAVGVLVFLSWLADEVMEEQQIPPAVGLNIRLPCVTLAFSYPCFI